MRPSLPNPRFARRGLTLLEMLVSVALLILMMTIITSIFQAATGAIIVAKTYQELDANLRQLDSVLRQDLSGATVDTGSGPLTPPIDPDLNLGYLEISEGQFADRQGEDSDDFIRFTVQAPEGQPFTGRMWVGPVFLNSPTNTIPNQPVMIQSRFAEVIYFLRNGNLYRRVFLVAPERQQAVTINNPALTNAPPQLWQFPITAFGSGVNGSWLGVNDLSARPSTLLNSAPILNTLGDLTNRENRMFYPRFSNDYLHFDTTMSSWALGPDGQWDDVNPTNPSAPMGDSVPDWWPTLYPNVFNTSLLNPVQGFPRQPNSGTVPNLQDLMSFPYTFPGAFSLLDPSATTAVGYGLLHGMGTSTDTGAPFVNGAAMAVAAAPPYGYYYANGASLNAGAQNAVNQPNHNPIPTGDSLTTPDMSATPPLQSWWGFPTWKETMSPSWADPVFVLASSSTGTQTFGLSWSTLSSGYLPPLNLVGVDVQPYNDGVGTGLFTMKGSISPYNYVVENKVFRDDIIMQGVRSFDVKVYDNAVPGYVDLGYSSFLGGTPGNPQLSGVLLQSMGHEGRIPPLTADFRSDASFPLVLTNIGDDTTSVNRLRRVWDTWSTDYTHAPAVGLNVATGGIEGPPFSQPMYPSYPPPYAAALRGVQIQVRVVDPRNERIKVLTIRHTFSN